MYDGSPGNAEVMVVLVILGVVGVYEWLTPAPGVREKNLHDLEHGAFKRDTEGIRLPTPDVPLRL
jgi:hypothetical protein